MKILPITKNYNCNVNKNCKPKNNKVNDYNQNQNSISFGKNKALIYTISAIFAIAPLPIFFIIKNKREENIK